MANTWQTEINLKGIAKMDIFTERDNKKYIDLNKIKPQPEIDDPDKAREWRKENWGCSYNSFDGGVSDKNPDFAVVNTGSRAPYHALAELSKQAGNEKLTAISFDTDDFTDAIKTEWVNGINTYAGHAPYDFDKDGFGEYEEIKELHPAHSVKNGSVVLFEDEGNASSYKMMVSSQEGTKISGTILSESSYYSYDQVTPNYRVGDTRTIDLTDSNLKDFEVIQPTNENDNVKQKEDSTMPARKPVEKVNAETNTESTATANDGLKHYEGLAGKFDYNPKDFKIEQREIYGGEFDGATVDSLKYIGKERDINKVDFPKGTVEAERLEFTTPMKGFKRQFATTYNNPDFKGPGSGDAPYYTDITISKSQVPKDFKVGENKDAGDTKVFLNIGSDRKKSMIYVNPSDIKDSEKGSGYTVTLKKSSYDVYNLEDRTKSRMSAESVADGYLEANTAYLQSIVNKSSNIGKFSGDEPSANTKQEQLGE